LAALQGSDFRDFVQEKKFPDRLLTFPQLTTHKFLTTMVKGSKLLAALKNEKGFDPKLERQKKQQKAAAKRKRSRVEEQEDEAVLEDAIKEAEEETVAGAAGAKKEKKDKKGAKRAKVEQEDEDEEVEEEWETDDEDKTHAVCLACAVDIAHTLY
jgi:rRNA-processing protein EBP2